MPVPKGPFAVIVTRLPDGWYRVTALYQSRNGRHVARSYAGHSRTRADAMRSVRTVAS